MRGRTLPKADGTHPGSPDKARQEQPVLKRVSATTRKKTRRRRRGSSSRLRRMRWVTGAFLDPLLHVSALLGCIHGFRDVADMNSDCASFTSPELKLQVVVPGTLQQTQIAFFVLFCSQPLAASVGTHSIQIQHVTSIISSGISIACQDASLKCQTSFTKLIQHPYLFMVLNRENKPSICIQGCVHIFCQSDNQIGPQQCKGILLANLITSKLNVL